MEPRDVYKLIYQGVRGPEHFISSPDEYARCLVEEFERVSVDPALRLTEPVCPDETLTRLNLCAYKAHSPKVEPIIQYLLDTVQENTCYTGDLQAAWSEFTRACEEEKIAGFNIGEVQEFSRRMEKLDYPAVHHSDVYRQEYKPAYRLLASRYIHLIG
jgi:hypothetical protein